MSDFDFLATILLKSIDSAEIANSDVKAATSECAKNLQRDFGTPSLPTPQQTVGVTLSKRKTAALFFDRVWSPPFMADPPPDEIRTYSATELEILVSFLSAYNDRNLIAAPEMDEYVAKHVSIAEALLEPPIAERTIVREYFRGRGIVAMPLYASAQDRNRDYKEGDTEALVAAVEGVAVVDESKLEWPQIVEFRRDKESVKNFRRIRHWLDKEFVGKSTSFISDEIAVRLEEYEGALKKHGVSAFDGVMSDLLDEKFVYGISGAVAATGVAGGGWIAALAGAGLVIGRTTLSIRKKMLDLGSRAEIQGSEVAFVHEIKELTK